MPRMKNGITYRTQTTLFGDDYDEPVERGPFNQIIRVSSGTVLCTYCGSKDVPQDASDIYGPLMLRLDHSRPTPVPEEFDPQDYSAEITACAAEWERAERAREAAASDPDRLAKIDQMMSRRFATTIACDSCIRICVRAQDEVRRAAPAAA